MDYIELSVKDVKKKSKILYQKVKKDFNYDLVVFIASGAYIIGSEMAKLNNVPLVEIKATRKYGKFKKLLRPILAIIPKQILIRLREKEMHSDIHEKNSNRQVSFNEKIYSQYKNKLKILLVDDSVDSGNSIQLTKKVLEEYFKNSEIRTAVFNFMSKSIIQVNYCLYVDTMLCGPWSNDSKENKEFNKLYSDWKREYER